MKIPLALCLIAAAALVSAQNDSSPRPQIRGTVLESGAGFGIAGVQVSLYLQDQKDPVMTIATNTTGGFDFQPPGFGHYTVKITADGYRPAPPQNTRIGDPTLIIGSQANVVLTRGNPSEDLHFFLERPAELTGRVIDDETGQPLARVPVRPAGNGIGIILAEGRGMPVLTGDDGRFVLSGLLPGNYAVELLPRTLASEQIMTQFSNDDLERVDRDFEKSFWPGGHDLASAFPIALASGQSLNLGTLRARIASYYRIHARFAPLNCPPDAKANIQLQPDSGSSVANPAVTGQVPCGSDFLIRGVQPGAYVIEVSVGRRETAAWGRAPVEVRGKNVEVPLTLERGVDVDARIVPAEGAPQPEMSQFTVLAQSLDRRLAGNGPATPDSDGRLRLINIPLGLQAIEMLRAAPGFYLREIRYNGHAQPGTTTFTLDGNSQAQLLELVVDNRPGAISGTVTDAGDPAKNPYVVAAKWPLTSDMLSLATRNAAGDEGGKFTIGGLSPGEYRIVAVPLAAKEKLTEPGVLDRLLAGAERVTLDVGALQSVQLKLTDPLR